jgi:hypothetical protein
VRGTGRGDGRFGASPAPGGGPTGVGCGTRPCRRARRRGAAGRSARAEHRWDASWASGGAPAREGTPPSAWRRRRHASRRWTPGSGVECAASGGSQGLGDATGTDGAAAGAGSWPGTRARPPRGRGASVAARRGRSRALGAPATPGDCRASIAGPLADCIHRTAGVRAPSVRWGGRGAVVRPLPIPIGQSPIGRPQESTIWTSRR